MNKKVIGSLAIDVWVDCPNDECGNYINLMDVSDTNGRDCNEEGHVISQACPQGHWSEEHKNFLVEDVTCSECKTTFDVEALEW